MSELVATRGRNGRHGGVKNEERWEEYCGKEKEKGKYECYMKEEGEKEEEKAAHEKLCKMLSFFLGSVMRLC